MGSSPHTRGAPVGGEGVGRDIRIIPAYAGSTTDKTEALGLSQGSSPHTRGALPDSHFIPGMDRIIPAYAGSTRSGRSLQHCRGDHPRIRGEHGWVSCVSCTRAGSSPHTRGAPRVDYDAQYRNRIIPAYAGSTRRCRSPRGRPADHPRIRGEHVDHARHAACEAGSSPHTRGARLLRSGIRAACRDHPRIRGEHYVVWEQLG